MNEKQVKEKQRTFSGIRSVCVRVKGSIVFRVILCSMLASNTFSWFHWFFTLCSLTPFPHFSCDYYYFEIVKVVARNRLSFFSLITFRNRFIFKLMQLPLQLTMFSLQSFFIFSHQHFVSMAFLRCLRKYNWIQKPSTQLCSNRGTNINWSAVQVEGRKTLDKTANS